mmetsp:Transcript_43281/g.85735  ORF Transcript_43281/g.85735 Transcript_43281/m.85735 type:complete len:95 (-) Transcript_43281:981-1265(-)
MPLRNQSPSRHHCVATLPKSGSITSGVHSAEDRVRLWRAPLAGRDRKDCAGKLSAASAAPPPAAVHEALPPPKLGSSVNALSLLPMDLMAAMTD